MKKSSVFLLILVLSLSSWSIDWVQNIEKSMKRIHKTAQLIVKIDTSNNGINSKFQLFKTDKEVLLNSTHSFEKFMNLYQDIYKNDTLIFSEVVEGIAPHIYKHKKKQEEPYGLLIEKVTYFKNKNYGIQKYRDVTVFGNEDIENLKTILSKKDFEVKEVNHQDYIQLEQQLQKLNKVILLQNND